MDPTPDPVSFDQPARATPAPDLDRIEALFTRSESIVVGLAEKFPHNEVFASHLAATRRGLALVARARAALAMGDRARLETAAAELAAVLTGQGKADRLAGLGLPRG